MEANDDPNITNITEPRNHERISVGTTGNIQGAQRVFYMNLGRVLKRRNITPMIASYRTIKIVYN